MSSLNVHATTPSQTPPSETVLVVDDVPTNLAVIGSLLQDEGYRVLLANSGDTALQYANAQPVPGLILLDVKMPFMDGYEVLRRLRDNPATAAIPVVFLTAMGDPADEERGLALGAADYIAKPIQPPIMLARVRTQLDAAIARAMLRDHNAFLEAEIARRMAENDRTQTVAIRALAHLAETRDPETGNHILRTQSYVEALASDLKERPGFSAQLTRAYITLLVRSAPLHDIGKVGIPDRILLKPGKLDAEEWVVMKTHAAIGAYAIEQAEQDAERSVDFLTLAKEIAHWHHERWDGSGYPDQLAGTDIPLSARLMALADVFDALINVRVYKSAMSHEEAHRIILEGRGSHFDPDIVDAFNRQFGTFCAIAERFADGVEPSVHLASGI